MIWPYRSTQTWCFFCCHFIVSALVKKLLLMFHDSDGTAQKKAYYRLKCTQRAQELGLELLRLHVHSIITSQKSSIMTFMFSKPKLRRTLRILDNTSNLQSSLLCCLKYHASSCCLLANLSTGLLTLRAMEYFNFTVTVANKYLCM